MKVPKACTRDTKGGNLQSWTCLGLLIWTGAVET